MLGSDRDNTRELVVLGSLKTLLPLLTTWSIYYLYQNALGSVLFQVSFSLTMQIGKHRSTLSAQCCARQA
jgi:hypothetical protein